MKNLSEQLQDINQVTPMLNAMVQQGLVSEDLATSIKNGKKTLSAETLYIRKVFSGALSPGTLPMIEPGDDKQIGVSSFPGEKTDTSDAFLVYGKAVRYSAAANIKSAKFTADLPAGLLDAEFRVVSDGNVKTRNLGREFAIKGDYAENGSDVLELGISKIIENNKPFQVEFQGADVGALTAPNKHILEVMLYVLAVTNKK